MAESAIENELLEVTKFKKKAKEDRQDYLARLMKAVSDPKKISDEVWESISKEAQDWNNGAAEQYKAGDQIEDFQDYSEEDDNPPVDEVADEEVEEAPAPRKPKTAKQEAFSKRGPVQPPRRKSACHAIKMMVVKKPTITIAEISEQLKDSDLKVSDVTIATLRSDLRDTLRVLNELDLGKFVLAE